MDLAKYSKATDSLRDLYRKQEQEKHNWFRFCVIEFVIIVILVITNAVTAMISKPYPWVVQVDEHGYEVSVGVAGNQQQVDERIIIARIGRFVQATRTVISDPAGQKSLLDWAFTAIPDNSAAYEKLDAFYKQNDPYKRGRDGETVQVQVNAILPKSEKTFQADWTETAQTGNGTVKTHWTGLFTIAVNPTKEIKQMIKNPLGIYITDYSITQELQ